MSQPKIFNRELLRHRRNKAAAKVADFDFLLKEVTDNLQDRLSVIKKELQDVLVVGDPSGWLRQEIEKRQGTQNIIAADIASAMNPQVVIDEEHFPFAEGSFDAVVNVLMLQWANDLPGALVQMKQSLKPNSVFLGALIGGQSLVELRQALSEAEVRLHGGLSPRVAPCIDPYDMSRLMQRAGFEIPVVDNEVLTVNYSSAFVLMKDLQGMGASNILHQRINRFSGRRLFMEAAKIYQEKFSDEDGTVKASFDITYFIGWTAESK